MTTDVQQHAQAISEQVEATTLSSNVAADGLKVGESLESDNGEFSGEVTDIRYKNLVSIWNRASGAHSYALPYMVADLAKQRIPDGRYKGQSAFVFRKSDIPAEVTNLPTRAQMLCYLNEESPDAARYHSMGFPRCNKHNLPSRAALELHMAKSHKRAWETIQREVEDTRRDEDRDFNRQNTLALQALVAKLTEGQGVTAAEIESPAVQAAIATVADAEVDDNEEKLYTATCPTCHADIAGKSQAGAFAALRGHENREHPTSE